MKNRVALDQSNDDPAGRAEQLKKSPGERWELLTATVGLHSFFSLSLVLSQARLAKLYTDENIAGNAKNTLITEGVMWREKRWRSPALQRHFLSNLICCISYFWSAISCIKMYIFTSSHDSTGFTDWTQFKSRNLKWNNKLAKGMTVWDIVQKCLAVTEVTM